MRIYLSASRSGMSKHDRIHAVSKIKPLYLLETFFNGESRCLQCMKEVGNDNFLLDSGAFSFMNGAQCTKELISNYTDRYIQFIQKNNIKYFFEIDVDTIFGITFARNLRNRIEKETGKKSIPVWHKCRGVEAFKDMCANYDFIAIGGLVFHTKKSEYVLIKKMAMYAKSKGVKCHGLGFTKTAVLDEYLFYSVDSASYVIAGGMGQQVHRFDGNKIIAKRLIAPNGKKCDLSKIVANNFVEWCKYQRYMDRKD